MRDVEVINTLVSQRRSFQKSMRYNLLTKAPIASAIRKQRRHNANSWASSKVAQTVAVQPSIMPVHSSCLAETTNLKSQTQS